MAEQEDKQAEPIDVQAFLAVFVEQLASLGWIKLGLQPDPGTKELKVDLVQARIAVDGATALAGVLEPHLDEADQHAIQNLVSNLKLNYVEKCKETGG